MTTDYISRLYLFSGVGLAEVIESSDYLVTQKQTVVFIMSILKVPTFAIITGASRGIGRGIAIQLARKIHPHSLIILTARSLQGLKETADIIKRDVDEKLDARCVVADMSDEKSITKVNKALFENIGPVSRFDHAILVHNAGTSGDIGKYARELSDINEIQKHYLINLTAPIALTSAFLKAFEKASARLRRTIVQLTSLSATFPQKTLHLYGMSKAARDLFFRVMALEEPEVRILTYDPGLVDTDLYSSLQHSKDSDLSELAQYLPERSYFLSPEQPADALMKTLEEDKYESGATVRCYEVLNIDVSEAVRLLNKK